MNEKLPNFLIVGAAKSGTTSLDQYLGQHKDIFMPTPKEPKFMTYDAGIRDFNGPGDIYIKDQIIKTFDDYINLYRNSHEAFRGDSSVDALYYYKETIPKIKAYLNDPKIVIVFRNPIERAFSSYLHLKRDMREPLSFREALEQEEQRMKEGYEFIWYYIHAGMYAKQVEAYLKNFSNVKIVLFDDLKKDALSCIREILEFLGADADYPIDVSDKSNVSGMPKNRLLQTILVNETLVCFYKKSFERTRVGSFIRSIRNNILQRNLMKEKMNLETKQYLQELFRADIFELEKLTGRDLSQWLQ